MLLEHQPLASLLASVLISFFETVVHHYVVLHASFGLELIMSSLGLIFSFSVSFALPQQMFCHPSLRWIKGFTVSLCLNIPIFPFSHSLNWVTFLSLRSSRLTWWSLKLHVIFHNLALNFSVNLLRQKSHSYLTTQHESIILLIILHPSILY